MTIADPKSTSLPARFPRIGLALGGGGARGLAHIHALEVLDELGLRPSIISGTSIGALMGAGYALGLSGRRMRAIAEETLSNRFDLVRSLFNARSDPVQKLLRLVPMRSALLNSSALLDLLVPEIGDRGFDALSIPLKVVATDLGTHEGVVFDQGPLRPAVAASIAIPLIFQPVRHLGRTLVDGGLVNPLPFELISPDVDVTIAIDVAGAAKAVEFTAEPSATDVLMQSIYILEKSITRQKLAYHRPDIYIRVDLDNYGMLEFWRPKEILKASEPIRDTLRRQLERVLTSQPLDPIPFDPGASP